ncbi:S-protein homolog 2-like [Macadamia integrifolia]|uniref:S-protein homolog 2-like n=1 Tax=Macadamia integrifolia TaxID=60698 RepID=UPI001C528C10|nr:S-protein homolog 2-like [Macadamia integrifolia]
MNALKFVLVLAFTLALSKAYIVEGKYSIDVRWAPKYTVHVINDLGQNQELNIHCKSKDDDLGPHTLMFGQEFSWTFQVNFFKTTLFWCNMQWGNTQGSFEIFNAKTDKAYGGKPYYRKVRKDGIYYDNDDSKRDGAYWKKYSW